MTVDLFSLRMNIQTSGFGVARAELTGLETAGQTAALQATNFTNAWSAAAAKLKGTAVELAMVKKEFAAGFFNEKMIAGMSLAGQAGARDSAGRAAMQSGIMAAGQMRREMDAAEAALKKKSFAANVLNSALLRLGAWYAGFSLLRFIGETIEAGGSLHELAQRTGATVQMLSVLRFAGAQSGVSQEQLAQGFRGLAMSLGQLRDGGDKVSEAYKRLGLTWRDLQGLSVDEVFLKVVQRMAAMQDGAEKAEVAQRVFGRSGAMLLPLLEDLATKGYGALAKEAEAAGAVITPEEARRMDAFSDAVTRLKVSIQGLIRDALLPVLPLLTGLIDGFAMAFRALTNPAGMKAKADWDPGAAILPGGGAAERLSSRSRNRFGAGIELMTDAEVKEAAREAADKRKLYNDEVLRRANMDESMRPASDLGSPFGRQGPMSTRSSDFSGLIRGGTFDQSTPADQKQQGRFLLLQEFAERAAQESGQLRSQFSMLGSNLGMAIGNGFSAALAAGIRGKNVFKAFGNVILQGLGSIMQQMGQSLLTYGLAMVKLLPFLSNPFTSGPAAIAAGVLLMGLGAALGGIATGDGGGGGGGGGGFNRDRTTNITLTADGAGGFMAPKQKVGDHYTVVGAKSPAGARIIGEGMKASKRANI
jgi:hypothetical protein